MARKRTGFLAVLVAAAISVIPAGGGPVPVARTALAAGCTKHLAYQDAQLLSAQKGGRERWITRTLSASDWAVGGFASEVLWVGTDNSQADTDWVEIGMTQGWQYTNTYQLYSAHGHNGGMIYDEAALASPPALGTTVTFTVRDYSPVVANSYIAEATWGSSFYRATWWSGHHVGTVDYSGGLEATCQTSQVDRTYVSLNQFQSNSGTYVTVGVGAQHNLPGTPSGIAWCSQPVTFRYWQNSAIPTGTCG